MGTQEIVKVFGGREIRSIWDDVAEKWYFSVVDVVAVLTESVSPANYWKVLKNRLKQEGNETVTNCNQLKLRAAAEIRQLTTAEFNSVAFGAVTKPMGVAVFRSDKRVPRAYRMLQPMLDGLVAAIPANVK